MDDTYIAAPTQQEKCVRCLEPVEPSASRCRNCGQPISNVRRMLLMAVGAAGIMALLFMLVVMYRTVYLEDLENAAPLADENAPVGTDDLFAEPLSAVSTPEKKEDEKPAEPVAPPKPPPLNR